MSKIIQGNCLDSMKLLEDNSVDAIVTDPPYGLSFMGKKWDYDVPSQEIWEECLRVLKPGGYLLSFAGTRTQHRMAVRIEDAGFEIRDMIAWVYGSGFPKSLNIGKAVDKLQGNEREEIRTDNHGTRIGAVTTGGTFGGEQGGYNYGTEAKITKGTSEWEGWGTALKPALEPITLARKPLSEKTVAENVLKWGTGGINIDGSRVESNEVITTHSNGVGNTGDKGIYGHFDTVETGNERTGRFPANFIHDGSDEVVELFPNTKGSETTKVGKTYGETDGRSYLQTKPHGVNINDSGSAARYFYCAKASKSERNRGCEGLEEKDIVTFATANGTSGKPSSLSEGRETKYRNNHPTVKPIALMEYLVKLVSKEGAVVLDPFAGSGSTLIACKNLNRNYIGMELDPEYIKICEARLKETQPKLL